MNGLPSWCKVKNPPQCRRCTLWVLLEELMDRKCQLTQYSLLVKFHGQNISAGLQSMNWKTVQDWAWAHTTTTPLPTRIMNTALFVFTMLPLVAKYKSIRRCPEREGWWRTVALGEKMHLSFKTWQSLEFYPVYVDIHITYTMKWLETADTSGKQNVVIECIIHAFRQVMD